MTVATDIHTHVVPSGFPRSIAGGPPPFEIRRVCGCGRADIFIDGKQFRTVTDECWAPQNRLETMDGMGVHLQVLSPMPELLSYWRPADQAEAIAEHVNATLADMVSRAPDRFAALGMVPLQDPDRSIRMLEMLMKQEGFRGVEIGTNIDGLALSDPRFLPFFEAAEQLGAAIFVHPVRPVVHYPATSPPAVVALAGFPCETALAAIALIMCGLTAKFPGLRLAFSHGGGALSVLLPRLDHGWKSPGQLREALGEAPSVLARRFYYDTLVFDRDTLAFLLGKFGKTQLCIGTDVPFAIAERAPISAIDALGLSSSDRDLLVQLNAARFLGL